ncbi:MAG: ABC transporter ATP-binding protein [Nitrospirota bacterium]|nr:ABC transporter ATP-binding protein [Nitrospirota bacterium]
MNVIHVENITKIYKLYDKPLDRLKELILHRPFHKEFVALDGISFSLNKGETLGIIGDNGAGKSTLLKILSRTLSPTRGHFEVKGLVSSLLELGSGFHPEFTGIENIFFYGSLLGIDNGLMKEKINEIADFAELGDFINYPIRTYSSGMHVRLAFSVATSVNPDILIIDEALSVGDQYFQKKCLEKMDDFKRRQKTIIFCSHDLYQVKTFCSKTMWLNHGQVKMLGESSQVVNAYVTHEQTKAEAYKTELAKGSHSSFLFISDLSVNQKGTKNFTIEFTVKSLEPFSGHIGWAILRRDMFQITFMSTHMQGREPILFDGTRKISITIDELNIVNDNYFVYVGVFDKQAYKPIAVESIDCTINTGYEILNSLCHFNSTFTVE